MATIQDVINSLPKRPEKPDENEMRRLPLRKAFILGRVSSPTQIKNSKESIREIAKLVDQAKEDGYKTGLTSQFILEKLELIQAGVSSVEYWEDGDVIVDVRDLGLSGQKSTDERKGLAHLQERIAAGDIGAVYLTEGVSRLSRDPDHILPYQLLKLLKLHQCRIRTLEDIWNPAIERDFDYLADEFEDAIGESKVMRRRMFRRKAQKAARGEFVGEPVPPGFILPILGRKSNGQYEFGKYELYSPHASVNERIWKEYIKCDRSPIKTARAMSNDEFPPFEPDFNHMVKYSSLRLCKKTASGGYRISPSLIKSMVKNYKMIGISAWGNTNPIINNHPAAISKDLFLAAYETHLTIQRKPRGRALNYEPLEWAGILWCIDHSEPEPISYNSNSCAYRCQHDYMKGQGLSCFSIEMRFFDEPLTAVVFLQLDLSPIAEEVLGQMESKADQGKLFIAARERKIAELERKIKNLEERLGDDDPEKDNTYWKLIREAKERLKDVQNEHLPTIQPVPLDFSAIKKFLVDLPQRWSGYPVNTRNRILRIILERVEISHDELYMHATMVWKTGYRQSIHIKRPKATYTRTEKWTPSEDSVLKLMWHDSSQDAVQGGIPDRSWSAIENRAFYLHLRREKTAGGKKSHRAWLLDDDTQGKRLYEEGVALPEIVNTLCRSRSSILQRAYNNGWKRPPSARWKKAPVEWKLEQDLKVSNGASSWTPFS